MTTLSHARRNGTPPGPNRPWGCHGSVVHMRCFNSALPSALLIRSINCSGVYQYICKKLAGVA